MSELPKELEVPAVAAGLVAEIGREPLRTAESLRLEVLAYDRLIAETAESNPVVDVQTASALTTGCVALLDWLADHDQPLNHLLVQVACRYYVLEEDAEGDLDSSIGFDDDAEVFNAVCVYLGLDELVIPI